MVQARLAVQVHQFGSSLVAPVPQFDLYPGRRIPKVNVVFEDSVFPVGSAMLNKSYVEALHV
jgi:hypothetical protein